MLKFISLLAVFPFILVGLFVVLGVYDEYPAASIFAVVGLVTFFLLSAIYKIYASLIRNKNDVEEAFDNITVYLRKRYDLIPNLVKTAKHVMGEEVKMLENVSELREGAMGRKEAAGNADHEKIRSAMQKEAQAATAIHGFFARAEDYPELRSVPLFMESMKAMKDVENDIAASRRVYNSVVGELNTEIEMFPSSFIANLLRIQKYPYYKDDDIESIKKPIDISELFDS